MMHEINLTGYTASCNAADNMLCLGTAGSYGLEKLHVTADAAWNGLTITATFTNSGSTTVAVSDGAVDVPPEATRLPTRDRMRHGMLAFKGVDATGKLRIISTPICYKVQASAATDGSNTIDPTPDQYAQFVAEVMAEADRAEAAADRAESAGGNVTPEQIAEAVNNYLNENPVQATPIDATLTQSGQAADAAAVGNRISALSEEIAAIPSGADGKSAYQYAVDGGYTGTETEFAEKMAQEKFANPNALTLTGAVSATYDGSAPLSVEIPSGGLTVINTAAVGQTVRITEVDENGQPAAWEAVEFTSGDVWELLYETTLTENAETFSQEIPACSKVKMVIFPGADVSGWKQIIINGKTYPTLNSAMSAIQAYFVSIDTLMPPYITASIGMYTKPSVNGINGGVNFSSYAMIGDSITNIGCGTAGMLVTGAIIKIWGVRK